VSRAVQALAASAYEDRARFTEDLEAFRTRRRDAYLGTLFRNEVFTPAQIEALPAFEPRPARPRVGQVLVDLVWLSVLSALLLLAGWRRFRL
jgi:hypothetical protein